MWNKVIVFTQKPNTIWKLVVIRNQRMLLNHFKLPQVQYICCLLFTFGFLFSEVSSAQSVKEKVKFSRIGVNSGLSNSNVTCILQDSKGFLWVGTRDGLNKYNGYDFTVYQNIEGDTTSLLRNFILCLYEDKEGGIWVSTQGGGLQRFDRKKNAFTRFNQFSSNCQIDKIIEGFDNSIWIAGYKDGQLFTAQLNNTNNVWSIYTLMARTDEEIKVFIQESENEFWVGGRRAGFFLWNKKTNSIDQNLKRDISKKIVNNDVHSAAKDGDGNIWIGTEKGLSQFHIKDRQFTNFKHNTSISTTSILNRPILDISWDGDYLWLGTENGGLSRFNIHHQQFSNYVFDKNDLSSLSDNSIWVVYKDHQERIWLGTFSRGLCVFDKASNKFSELDISLENDVVNAIYQDQKNRLWIGTEGGLVMKDGDHIRHYMLNPENINGNAGSPVLSIQEDSKKQIWVGTWAAGLHRYDEKNDRFISYLPNDNEPKSISDRDVFSIIEYSKTKQLFAGCFGGLNILTNDKAGYFENHRDEVSVDNNNLLTLFEDSKGRIWTGSTSELNRYNPETKNRTRFHLTNHGDTTNTNESINCVFETLDNSIWAGTTNGLFHILDDHHFKRYTIESGLPSNMIMGILEDSNGNLWISTTNGLSCFNPQAGSFRNFNITDGLPSNEFKRNSCFKSKDGHLFFGGKGISVFHPDSIQLNTEKPPVYISDFKVFNRSLEVNGDDGILTKPIEETSEIWLPYAFNFFNINFVAINFTATEKNTYRYMLEGFDHDWVSVGHQRTATYTNLDAGTYTFRVKAGNNDGIWNEEGAYLTIHVMPPWWKTWWMKLGEAVLFAGVVLLIYRVRIRNRYLSKLTQLKEKLESEKYMVDFLMENLPVLIYFKDKNSRFIRVSKFMANYFNKDGDDIIGKTDFDIQDEKHAREAFEDEQEIIRNGKSKGQYLEKETHSDGTEKWVSTTKVPLLNAAREVVGTIGISTDVTQVKHYNDELLLREEEIKAQNEELHSQREELAIQNEKLAKSQIEIAEQNRRLQASEEELTQNLEKLKVVQDVLEDINRELVARENQLRQIFNGVPAMIFQFKITADGKLSFPIVSKGSIALYGLEPEVLMKDAMSAIRCILPEDFPIYEQGFANSLESPGKEVKLELRAIVDNRIKWIQVTSMPERLDDGSTLWSGIILDISRRKEAELTLSRTQEMLEQTNHLARVGGWEFDLVNKKVTWSKVAKEISEVGPDFEPDLYSGLNLYKDGENKEKITNAIEKIKKDGIPFDLTLQAVSVTGNERWIRSLGHAEFKNGKCVRIYGVVQDINEQIKATMALAESERNFRQINETIEEVFWLYDILSQKYIYISPTCEKIWEISQDSFYKGTSFVECILEDDKDNFIQATESLPENKSYEIEYQIRTKSGKIKWMHEKSFAILNEDGVYVKNSGICADITEKKKNQQQIEQLSIVAEKTTNGVLIADTKGITLWANQGYLNMMEIKLEQLLNKRPSELFNAEDKELRNTIANVMNTNYSLEFELTTYKKNKKWVKLSSTVILNEIGEPIQQIEVLTDITLLKKIEQELQETNTKLIQSQGEIALKNNKLVEQSEELAAQNEELIQSSEEIMSQRDQLATQNTKLQDAQTIIEEQNQDIRSRNENLEDEVARRTKEIVEYNHQLEQFAFISAHNLRAPVARILGLGQILELPSQHVSEKGEIIDKLIHTTVELDTVVRDLNKILEIRKDSHQPLTEINLYRELLLTETSLQHEIDNSHAVITKDFSEIEIVKTVKPYLDSILYNILSNAIKYRHPRRDPQITIQSSIVDDYICLRFSDNGLGINLKMHKEKMFTLYKRFHFHTDGKGLGLYLVKNQIDSLNGKIEVESKVDEGTTFKIYFKRA